MSPSVVNRPLGITMGDANGIGPEIIAKLFAQGLPHPTLVYGDAGVMQATIESLGLQRRLRVALASSADAALEASVDVVPVLNRWQALPDTLVPGQVNAQAGRGAYEYLCHAIDDALAGDIRSVVTAPLHKLALQQAGIDYPGHTEILADRTGTQDYAMLLATDELRVILVTIHVPLAQVPALVTHDAVLKTIELAHRACRRAGINQPRVAVAGLNPHAGEDGRFGREDIDVIEPAIQTARRQGIDASGPWPGDTIFMRARTGEFDIVVAQYHDQGLIPIKYLGVDGGVNMTVGLPFVRTSVDHGTAFDIAGQGIADERSLRKACELALEMSAGSDQPTGDV